MKKKRIVVFDLDGTLTPNDTFISFSCYFLGLMRFLLGIFKSSPWLLCWKMGFISGGSAKRKLYSFLYKGYKKDRVVDKAKYYHPDYRQEVISILNQHKENGDTLYIISASLDLWVEQIARNLGVKSICTGTSVDIKGRLDGSFSTANCYGDEKVRRLKEVETEPFFLTVYGDEPEGGDSSLFQIADRKYCL